MTQGTSHSIKLNEWQSLSERTLICTTASHVVSSQFIGTNHEMNMWLHKVELQISRFHELWPYCIVPFWMHTFGSASPYRFTENEELYREVINQFEKNNQSLVRENIRLRDTYCRLHTKLGCLTQQFTVLAVSPIIQCQCFIWQLVSVMSCQLSALHYYSMCGQFAKCAKLIHYAWAVCQLRYINTLHVGSFPTALH
jgi:hypothetical protein